MGLKLKSKLFSLGLILVIILIVGCKSQPSNLDGFASCLTEKGAIMYGASWCSHCTEQKEMFGDAFSKVSYIECEEQKQLCAQEEIQYLPTWKFTDGTVLTGVQDFSTLAEKTGCDIN